MNALAPIVVLFIVALAYALWGTLLPFAERRRERRTRAAREREAHRPKVRPVGRPAYAWVWACGCTALDARNVGAANTQHEACTSAGRHVRAERERTSS